MFTSLTTLTHLKFSMTNTVLVKSNLICGCLSLMSLRCPYNNKSHLPQKIVARQECSSRMQKSKLKLVESKYVTIKNRTHKKSTKAFSILVWVLVLVLLAWSFQNNDLLPSGSVYAFTISNVIIDLD